jgi:predicted DNA-binding transcriptional regulator YafY
MAVKNRLYAQFALMNYLHGSRDRSVQEILEHLHHNTDWGRAQLGPGGPIDLGERNVQNWLKDIRNSPEFAAHIDYSVDPDNRRQHLYSWIGPAVGNRIMPIEEACTLLMAEKFLDFSIPADFYDASLQDLFIAARQKIADYEKAPKNSRRRVSDYLKRIAVDQRSQALVHHEVPYDVLGVLSRAILEGRRVLCRYRDDLRELHPFAIVLRSPKIYLLAVDDHVIRKVAKNALVPAQFICARIAEAEVSDKPNLVPDDFNADDFIEQVGLDVDAMDWEAPERGFKLILRIFDGESDNLLADLREFPLSKYQEIMFEEETGHHLLMARRMRATHQLIEWIMGRLDRVEVVAPLALRDHIVSKLSAMQARYT